MKVLINAAVATDATKQEFVLDSGQFQGSSLPAIKTTGLGAGDSVRIFENINGTWQLGTTLDSTTISTVIRSAGIYAVDIIMATAGPATVQLDAVYT